MDTKRKQVLHRYWMPSHQMLVRMDYVQLTHSEYFLVTVLEAKAVKNDPGF
jgi:hypothetical protein